MPSSKQLSKVTPGERTTHGALCSALSANSLSRAAVTASSVICRRDQAHGLEDQEIADDMRALSGDCDQAQIFPLAEAAIVAGRRYSDCAGDFGPVFQTMAQPLVSNNTLSLTRPPEIVDIDLDDQDASPRWLASIVTHLYNFRTEKCLQRIG